MAKGTLGRILAGLARAASKPAPDKPTVIDVVASVLVPDRNDAVLDVVGEHAYQESIHDLLGNPMALSPGFPTYVAFLRPEPENPVDKNAIAIFVNGRRVGYLSRDDAERYLPVCRCFAIEGKLIGCEAKITGGRYADSLYGVALRLGTPGETLMDCSSASITVSEDHEWRGQMMAFTGETRYEAHGVRLDREFQVALARKAGLVVYPRVTKKVQLLVDCDPGGQSGNQLKAIDYGIRVVTEEVFWQTLGVPITPAPWAPPRRYRSR